MFDHLSIIPYPQSLVLLEGKFVWDTPYLDFDPLFRNEADYLSAKLPTRLQLGENEEAGSKIKLISETYQSGMPEAYTLTIHSTEVCIQSATPAGIFYGIQTLLQIINSQSGESTNLPCMQIIDQPRFTWRGFMLDEGRYFHGIDTVKSLIDWMARLKMNVFHWHLTEDQGWRIEIKQYPKLTEIGSKRSGSQTGNLLSKQTNSMPHSGFYTQKDILEILAYATERHITVVPEIEIPGHSLAALAAYPEFGCTGGPYQVSKQWGIFPDIYCAGNKETVTFLENILNEVLELFPGKYIHIGGDEAPKKRWGNCPKCKIQAKKLGLSQVSELQTVLTNHFNQFLNERNRKLIGWNEMLNPKLSMEAIVQFWTGNLNTLNQHIRSGRKAILSNYAAYYLDHSYLRSALDKVYTYEPINPDLEPEFHENILGIEIPLWTEFVPDRARLDWQVFPRLFAAAESAWLMPEKKNYASFRNRLDGFLPLLDQEQILYPPESEWDPPKWKWIWGLPSILQAQTKKRDEA